MPPVARGMIQFAARDLLDEDGRPVAEVASPHYAAVPTELVACPYPDRRRGQPMNLSALRQLGGVWPEALAAFAALAGPAPTVHRAWAAAITGVALPLVAPRPTPRALAGLFKASLGMSQVMSSLLLAQDDVAALPLTALGDADGFFGALDAGGWLIGAEQVCAGTRAMIGQAFDAMVGRTAAGDAGEVPTMAARVGDRAVIAVALHVVHLTAHRRAARRGEGPAPSPDVAPWLRAVAAIPDRPPEHVRRLFPGPLPDPVAAVLAASARGIGALDEAFAEAIGELDG